MNAFPTEPKKIMERIRRYERALRKDIKTFGFIEDGAGKRYLLGALYLILGDAEGAVQSYKWLEQVLPDDMGEPFDHLCWSLALYRAGDTEAASRKLLRTMLHNLYLLPALLGLKQDWLEIWHGDNWAEKSYIDYAPAEIFSLWDEPALEWAGQMYRTPRFQEVRDRYIEICQQLKSELVGSKRSQLVREMFQLRLG